MRVNLQSFKILNAVVSKAIIISDWSDYTHNSWLVRVQYELIRVHQYLIINNLRAACNTLLTASIPCIFLPISGILLEEVPEEITQKPRYILCQFMNGNNRYHNVFDFTTSVRIVFMY